MKTLKLYILLTVAICGATWSSAHAEDNKERSLALKISGLYTSDGVGIHTQGIGIGLGLGTSTGFAIDLDLIAVPIHHYNGDYLEKIDREYTPLSFMLAPAYVYRDQKIIFKAKYHFGLLSNSLIFGPASSLDFLVSNNTTAGISVAFLKANQQPGENSYTVFGVTVGWLL